MLTYYVVDTYFSTNNAMSHGKNYEIAPPHELQLQQQDTTTNCVNSKM